MPSPSLETVRVVVLAVSARAARERRTRAKKGFMCDLQNAKSGIPGQLLGQGLRSKAHPGMHLERGPYPRTGWVRLCGQRRSRARGLSICRRDRRPLELRAGREAPPTQTTHCVWQPPFEVTSFE